MLEHKHLKGIGKKKKLRVNSCRKGKLGERAWAKKLTELGFPASRGQQHKGGPNSPDVVCESLPGVHFEVKFGVKGLDLGTKAMDKVMQKARDDCSGTQVAILAWKPNGCSHWRMTYVGASFRHTLDRDCDIKAWLESWREWK